MDKTTTFELICKAMLMYVSKTPGATHEHKNIAMGNFLGFLEDNLKPKSRRYLKSAMSNVIKEYKELEVEDGKHQHGSD